MRLSTPCSVAFVLPPPGTMEIVVALKASNALATCLHRSKRIIINKSDSPDRGAGGDNFGRGG